MMEFWNIGSENFTSRYLRWPLPCEILLWSNPEFSGLFHRVKVRSKEDVENRREGQDGRDYWKSVNPELS